MDNRPEIQVTSDYDRFRLMGANRDVNRGHVEILKIAFEEMGNLTQVQPILVNDQMEIIDGQHRFLACKELNEPIYFTTVPGLTVGDARRMNVLHRGWKLDDYAKSYAQTDPNYRKYLDLKEDYGFNHSVIIRYIYNQTWSSHGHGNNNSPMKSFRNGELVIEDEAGIRGRLDKLHAVSKLAPMASERECATAILRIINMEEVDFKRFLRKLELHPHLLKRYASAADYLRMFEEIYNYQMSEAKRLRIY